LSTLAFSEAGSRSHFWAPLSTSEKVPGGVRLNAHKSWITSAAHATAYVWSSKPLTGSEASTIWLVPSKTSGVSLAGEFDGLGMRGNNSAPVTAEAAVIPEANRLGAEGQGFSIMMEVALPVFNVLNSACAVGLCESAVARTTAHLGAASFAHLSTRLIDLPTIRASLAKMRLRTDMARTLWLDTIAALENGRADAMLRVLECKTGAGETAIEVGELAMRVCGGAAFRKEVGVERCFRDAHAMGVMAPTTDLLYDLIGKAIAGLPLF
jgi:alkylation response protein AidB-like acyl-CoA dehydrogenase